jgi:uncharacterized protein YaaQ
MTSGVDQLMLITVSGEQTPELVQTLNGEGFYVTLVDSRGGLLDERLSTLLIGYSHGRQGQLLSRLREECRTRRRLIPAQLETPLASAQTVMIEAETGGAAIFIFDLERFEQV